jgi:hypothetical protein
MMPQQTKPPSFDQFSRWLAARLDRPALDEGRYGMLKDAAREARHEFMQSRELAAAGGARARIEPLYLLAAADKSASSLPPEITTASGFRVALAFDEGSGAEEASICVLVHCPPELIASLEGQTVYLWCGDQRFEIGQFDAEGKAIGLLPSGLKLAASDFAEGRVRLEEPPLTAD